jgi:hypothetical protein
MPHADNDKHWMKFFLAFIRDVFPIRQSSVGQERLPKKRKIKERGVGISATGRSERKILALPSKREKYLFWKCKGREGEG